MKDFKSANFPIDGEGRTYHVATKLGETANRILTVGDPERARRLAKHLDHIEHEILSKRGFLTITGPYKGVQVVRMVQYQLYLT
jgi:uridine phosphorylase